MKDKKCMTIKFIHRYTIDNKVDRDKITEHDCECDVEVETNFNRSFI